MSDAAFKLIEDLGIPDMAERIALMRPEVESFRARPRRVKRKVKPIEIFDEVGAVRVLMSAIEQLPDF